MPSTIATDPQTIDDSAISETTAEGTITRIITANRILAETITDRHKAIGIGVAIVGCRRHGFAVQGNGRRSSRCVIGGPGVDVGTQDVVLTQRLRSRQGNTVGSGVAIGESIGNAL